MSTALEQETSTAMVRATDEPNGSIAAFASHEKFRAAQRIATALAASTIVPKAYQNNVANCLVAMELASRTGASVLMVMQNLHIIQGRPSWSAAFLVASVNSSGRFSPIRYEIENDGKPTQRVRAYARELASGDLLVGEWIDWSMVKGEGWLGKDGSKWKTMPGQMFRYRAAAFWVRAYSPETSLGMHTADEVQDIPLERVSTGTRELNAAIQSAQPASGDVVDAETGEVITPMSGAETIPAKPATVAPPCEACGALPGEPHKEACPYAD